MKTGADPGFPWRKGCQVSRGRVANTPFRKMFPKNCLKLRIFWAEEGLDLPIVVAVCNLMRLFPFTEPYIHWMISDDVMTNQVQPSLVSVNISHFLFRRKFILSSEGVTTLYNCTIQSKTFVLDLFRSQHEMTPSYLIRNHILPHLEQSQFKIIKTKFKGEPGQEVNAFFHLYNGPRQISISGCALSHMRIYVNIGNQSLSATSSHFGITVLKINIDNSNITDTIVRIHTLSQHSYGSVAMANSVLHGEFVWKYRPGGFVGILCDNCTFSASDTNKPHGYMSDWHHFCDHQKFKISNKRHAQL